METFLSFLAVAAVAMLVPGPDTFVVLRTALADGPRAGRWAAAGSAFGNVLWGVASVVGVAGLLAASSGAFAVVKLAGAAYLMLLGAAGAARRRARREPGGGGRGPARGLGGGGLPARSGERPAERQGRPVLDRAGAAVRRRGQQRPASGGDGGDDGLARVRVARRLRVPRGPDEPAPARARAAPRCSTGRLAPCSSPSAPGSASPTSGVYVSAARAPRCLAGRPGAAPPGTRARAWRSGAIRTTFLARPSFSSAQITSAEGSSSSPSGAGRGRPSAGRRGGCGARTRRTRAARARRRWSTGRRSRSGGCRGSGRPS